MLGSKVGFGETAYLWRLLLSFVVLDLRLVYDLSAFDEVRRLWHGVKWSDSDLTLFLGRRMLKARTVTS